MRIAHCIHGLGLGGAQKVIASLAELGTAAGDEVIVYSSHTGVLQQEIESAGARVEIVPRRLPKLDPLWTAALSRAMRRDRVELVHCHLFGDTWHGSAAARRLGLPVLATMHVEMTQLPVLQRWGYRRLLPSIDSIVACSHGAADSIAAEMQNRGNSDRELSIETIPNGVPTPPGPPVEAGTSTDLLRNDLELSEDAVIIAHLGRLIEQKRPLLLLEAFETMEPVDGSTAPHLVFVGDGPLRRRLEDVVASGRGHERAHVLGFRSDVADVLRAVDVVAFSSDFEGLPIALLEAMACSRALVVTEVPGFLETVDHDLEALVVPSDDRDALSSALERLCRDGALRKRLGEAARQRYAASYSASGMFERYRELYQRLLAR